MDDSTLFEAIIDNAVDGIITIDQHGVIQSVNPSLCRMFGYSNHELVKQNIAMLMPAKHKYFHQNYINSYIQTGNPNIIGKGRELAGQKKDGSLFSVRIAISKVEDNTTLLFAGIIQDLTPEKRAEAIIKQHALLLEKTVQARAESLKATIVELQKTKDEIYKALLGEQEIGRMKSRFVSMASHEFRSPLSVINLSTSVVERYYQKLSKEKVMEYIGKIKSAVTELTTTLDDFLSIEKIELGTVKAVNGQFNLRTMTETVCEELSFTRKNGQKIIYNHHAETHDCVLDKNLLKHCLVNLLSNAIKYSAANDEIEVDSYIDEKGVKLTVRDYGIGVPDNQRKNLFEAFFRGSNTRDIQGTGLGLSIVKKYAEIMGGTVTYTCPPIKGSTFCLEFPMAEYTAKQ